MPRDMADLIKAFETKNFNTAFDLHSKLYDVSRNMFIEGNPVTVKTAMKILGLVENDDVRLPLVSSEQKTIDKLIKLFQSKELI